MKKFAVSLILAFSSMSVAQGIVQYGDVVLETQPTFAENVQDKAVVLRTANNSLGLYIFCVDSRTANVSLFIPYGDFTEYGYHNGARVPVTWQADSRSKVNENWQVIGRDNDLRRYGKLGLITKELFFTQSQFKVALFDKRYTFPARGINTAMRQLPCVIPFLKGMGYIR